MMKTVFLTVAALLPATIAQQSSATCGPAPSGSIRPSVASGYHYQVVATGLSRPRGIHFDNEGHLLVVESRSGGRVVAFTLEEDDSGCITASSPKTVTEDADLNHGIELSDDGNTLYASNSNDAYAWDYDSSDQSTSNRRTLVTNMEGDDHVTRTLLLSRTVPDWLVVSFGSRSNLDIRATEIDDGSATVKAFNLANRSGEYDYPTEGTLLGWGLRNEVGLAEHPNSGGIWGIENSADQLSRHGLDVWENNPGEELNFLGYLNGTETSEQGSNFGYPWCYSAWKVDEIPENQDIEVGTQFAIDEQRVLNGENKTDQFCSEQTQSRLVFEAHMAPLDIKFNNSGREAWVAFHGSWNSPDPVGYKLSVVEFSEDGEPVDEITSTTAATDIFSNENVAQCAANCFRPVAMAFDSQGRIFMTSDSTGEVYMIARDAGATGTDSSPTSSATSASESNGAPGSSYYTLAPYVAPLIAMLV